jgi:hypothetical protein
MSPRVNLISTIISDDCRKEDNGKDIIIGVYTGGIFSGAVPFILPTLAVRFEIIPAKLVYERVKFVLRDTVEKDIVMARGKLSFNRINLPAAFFFKFGPVKFEKEGQHSLWLGMDEDPELVGLLNITKSGPPPTEKLSSAS